MIRVGKFLALLVAIITAVLHTSCSPTGSAQRGKPARKMVLKPQVTIHNTSKRDIVVGVDGPESRIVNVAAGSKRTLVLKSGTYKYAVAAENMHPTTGERKFEPNHRYTWNFEINQLQGVSF
ncbi:MAG: hypothetical protein ACPH2J_01105 [Akkermansiaceae bacterium]